MSRRLIILFLLFWLPLQGWGGSVMPYSPHGGIMWMPAESEAMPGCPEHRHEQTGAARHDCEGCGLCHLASAPAATVIARLFDPIPGGVPLPDITLPAPESVPASLQRPPIA